MRPPTRSIGVIVGTVVTLAFVASSCASNGTTSAATGGSSSSATAEPLFPVTIDAANGEVTIEQLPERIVSISPTATEMLFAVDAGPQVVAVDDYSNYPADAPTTDLSGFEPNVEAIAAYEPDLVVFSGGPEDLERSLDKLKIPALLQPAAADLDDVYDQIEELGAATGHPEAAATVIATMQTDIDEIVASIDTSGEDRTYYHELDDTLYSVTSSTFIGTVYAVLGLENIADEADGAGSGYPQLSAEYVIDADPDLIFLADTKCCGQTAEKVAKRPGWDGLQAVGNGGVVELDDDVASRWGPRIVDLLRTVAGAINAQAAA